MENDKILEIKEWKEEDSRLPIEIKPCYDSIRDEILQPDKVSIVTHYFMKKWAPRLGPTLTLLVIRLRMYCYYNKSTDERRDWCFPSQETIAQELGVSVDTVQRQLKRPEAKFFVKIEPRYTYNPKKKRKVRTSNRYHVKVVDPLTPENQELLRERVFEKLENNEKSVSYRDNLTEPQIAVQFAEPVEKSSSKPQIAVQHSYRKLREEEVPIRSTLNNVNVVNKKTFKNPSPEDQAIINLMVDDILSICGDRKSSGWYALICQKFLEHEGDLQTVYKVLRETREMAEIKKIRTTKGQFFSDAIKREAQARSIDLKVA